MFVKIVKTNKNLNFSDEFWFKAIFTILIFLSYVCIS